MKRARAMPLPSRRVQIKRYHPHRGDLLVVKVAPHQLTEGLIDFLRRSLPAGIQVLVTNDNIDFSVLRRVAKVGAGETAEVQS